jgi:hypothetical protein
MLVVITDNGNHSLAQTGSGAVLWLSIKHKDGNRSITVGNHHLIVSPEPSDDLTKLDGRFFDRNSYRHYSSPFWAVGGIKWAVGRKK